MQESIKPQEDEMHWETGSYTLLKHVYVTQVFYVRKHRVIGTK